MSAVDLWTNNLIRSQHEIYTKLKADKDKDKFMAAVDIQIVKV